MTPTKRLRPSAAAIAVGVVVAACLVFGAAAAFSPPASFAVAPTIERSDWERSRIPRLEASSARAAARSSSPLRSTLEDGAVATPPREGEEGLDPKILDVLDRMDRISNRSFDGVVVVDDELGLGAAQGDESSVPPTLERLELEAAVDVAPPVAPLDALAPPAAEAAAPPAVETTVPSAPTIAQILRLTLPASGVWLCSPILSAIDTSAVGLLGGVAQQAALNPAVSVSDYGALLLAFLYTATTNLVAGAVQDDRAAAAGDAEGGRPRTTATLVTALKLSLLAGSLLSAVLFASGDSLLRTLMGPDARPEVFSAASRYVRIRSLGMPAAAVVGSAQSACLGMRDVKSPLYVLMAAAAVNFLGDAMLVPWKGNAWVGGAAGAAWATVASQYAAMAFFARWLTTRPGSSGDDQSSRKGKRSSFFRSDRNKDRSTSNGGSGPVDITKGILDLTGTSEAGRPRRRKFLDTLASSKLTRTIRSAGEMAPKLQAYGNARDPTLVALPDGRELPGATTTEWSGESSYLSALNSGKSVVKRIIEPAMKTRERQRTPTKPPRETRGFLSDSGLTLRRYLSFSRRDFDRSKAREFLPFVVPVTTTSVGRISGWIAMSHVASSALGTVDAAAHQIVFSVFMCLAPLVDALSQVAQSLVPGAYEVKERRGAKGRERARALRETVGNFRKVGAGFVVVLACLAASLPWIGRAFATDPTVLARVNGAVPGAGLFLLVNGLMCAGEGKAPDRAARSVCHNSIRTPNSPPISALAHSGRKTPGSLLGQKDLTFLRNAYALFFFAVPAYMLRLKRRALAGLQVVDVGTMWAVFSVYNVVRALIWHLRLARLQRRTERGVTEVDYDR
ncbi:hypothetical protein ACHAWF_016121 [Thalassiosira exigua]